MTAHPQVIELRAEVARRSLYEFVKLMWPVLEPGTAFQDGWHIRLLCDQLEAVTRGQIRRLIINLPPRHGKSNIVSILWPAWVWATYPEHRWLFVSYASSLAEQHASRARRVVESPEYQQAWGPVFRLTEHTNQKGHFENDRGGARLSLGIGGGITGQGADTIVIDDAHKVDEAESKHAREAVCESFDSTISSRLNNPATGAIVIVSQRVHERDLVGHILAREINWTHIALPAEFEPGLEFPRFRGHLI